MPRTILISGASSGIGAALALLYAQEKANLFLIARNPARLAAVAAQAQALGAAMVETGLIDVGDGQAVADWIAKADASFPIDLLIANAGITGGTSPDGRLETVEESARLFQTNVLGMAATVSAVLPGMAARGRGQIGIVSSIAAFLPLAGVPSYCASKAANLTYALSLRETLRPHGIQVSAICPGYVDTPLLARLEGRQPLLLSPADAANRIRRGLARNQRIIAFPAFFVFLTRLIALLPPAVQRQSGAFHSRPWPAMTSGRAPRVSIALATFNGARFLPQQLESLAQQSLPPLELVVGDDGSTDETLAQLARFAQQAPFPVRVEQNSAPLGYRANFMSIAERCQGDLIAFCDQDDVWSPLKLAVMTAPFDNPDVLLAFHNDVLVDDNGRSLGLASKEGIPSQLYAPLTTDPWRPVPGHSQVMRRDLLQWAPLQPQCLDPLDQRQAMAHDQFFAFWAGILGAIAYESTPLVRYRQHGANLYGIRERSAPARVWRDIKGSCRFYPSEAAATEQRIAMLRDIKAQLSPHDRERVEAAIGYYAEMLPHLAERARLYTDPNFFRRLKAFALVLQGGGYRNAKPWCFGLGGLAMDYALGLPFGPALKYLSRGERV